MIHWAGYSIAEPTLVLGAVAVVGVAVGVWGLLSARGAHRRITRALGGVGGDATLEERLAAVMAEANRWSDRERQLADDIDRLRFLQRHALSRVGLVRYNPFEDTGADLSFSMAVLTDELNGVVLTSLWGRDEVRVYAKPVESGASRYALSQEEKQSIDLAKNRRLPGPERADEASGPSVSAPRGRADR